MLVERVVRRALERGWADHTRHDKVIYHAEIKQNRLYLWHYKTLILVLDLETKEVVSVGGKSTSDANAINKALAYFGVEGIQAKKGEYCVEVVKGGAA